jgi:hypothetical protein
VQNKLTAEIHRTSLWSVVVIFDGNICKPNRTDFIDRNGSYIILMPDRDIKGFKVEINGLAEGRENEFTKIWNSEARVVVAGQMNSQCRRKRIYLLFLKHRIYNCISISQENYVIYKEYGTIITVNDKVRGKKLKLFTLFPCQSRDSCTGVNDITLQHSWVISAQGHFTKNTALSPRNISKILKVCPMKAVVREVHWDFITE